ncbi:hypothetical protein K458DRAFT_38703 [Lentithecium fluviatile CBS 122367]|uniref:PH domain-containing protein n=1 Tax=Lentithecium fluviatile CBS 122367 TaxID=1168545 RepID=A0A6G1J1W1_9PLEO|nr:hypothetical protein K458DRAFT_38703 [Lentithecium fluviatile CBS 122367]
MFSHDKTRLHPGHGPLNGSHDNNPMSRWRRNRSSAHLTVPQPTPAPASPTSSKPAPTLSKASSRISLFNLFSKPKVEKARGHTEVGLAVPMQPPEPPKRRPASPPKSSLRHNPPPPVQQVQRMRSSQMIRPMSVRPPAAQRPSDDHWQPPPLFQAYPQSIKYATVQACAFSPDMLLRTQSQRKQAELLRERMDSHRDLSATLENETKKLEKSHRRLNSVLNSSPQLSNKVFVLVTSGYVLQYAGDGPFDRLPEKVLKLGKDSAAFASDLIPGKHWVLQVLQSANEDGTATVGPKHSLLSRLRIQGTAARRTAASFLLVMESAEEMESWMTAVRKEIENFGGMKTSVESSRASSSIEEEPEKQSTEVSRNRYVQQRQINRMSKMASTPVDSPLQSQYSESPRIVASDWEGDRAAKTISIADTTSMYSTRHSTHRRSVEASSIATTAISHEQVQLDQLRERSRFSYMSTATSASGTGTRNTSRNSSPAPQSPLKEGFSPAESEPLRSATSLRSFHMNPGNTTTRRRSMQPLPVTNEDGSLSAVTPPAPQRHSIYGPTSPTTREPPTIREPAPPIRNPKRESRSRLEPGVLVTSLESFTPNPAPLPANRLTLSQLETQNLVRYNARSSSAPPSRNLTVSPPPRDPAPTPPAPRPQSTIGNLPGTAALSNHAERRVSLTPKPFLRPFPVRPQTQRADGSVVVPRRMSSLTPSGPAPIPLGIAINRSATAPARPPSSASRTESPSRNSNSFQTTSPTGQQLRRPTSVQIRSDPAPFLSSRRIVSSTPSFVPGNRASVQAPAPTPALQESPSIPVLRGQAPPPNMPLPPPPPFTLRPVAV